VGGNPRREDQKDSKERVADSSTCAPREEKKRGQTLQYNRGELASILGLRGKEGAIGNDWSCLCLSLWEKIGGETRDGGVVHT